MCSLHAGRVCLSSTVLWKDWALYKAQILFYNLTSHQGLFKDVCSSQWTQNWLKSSYWRFQLVLFSKCFCSPHEPMGKMRETSVAIRRVLPWDKVVAGSSNLCLPVFNTQTISLQYAADHN